LSWGLDRDRVTFPVRDAAGALAGILRYGPDPDRRNGTPKMVASKGSRRGLFPRPEQVEGDTVWVVEGEPDAVSATTIGLAAVGVPGVEGWRTDWATRFAGRRVVVCFDCDAAGRGAARRVAEDLAEHAVAVRVLDLDPGRDDGHDLGDLVTDAAQDGPDGLASCRLLLERTAEAVEPQLSPDQASGSAQRPLGTLLTDLEEFVARYVVLPGAAEATALVLWVAHSWAIDAAHATPYLAVLSPEKRTGKTRLLEAVELLVARPWRVTAASEAALFRKIAQDHPTLLMDEVDAVFGSHSERTEPLRAILNAGNRPGATIARCVGDGAKPASTLDGCPTR